MPREIQTDPLNDKPVHIDFLRVNENTKVTIQIPVKFINEDDCPGIPVSEYENVFKPFYKIDKSRGGSKSSVGLGLSISSDIVRSHGGKIELGNAELGGLKVKISLPV